MGGDIKYAHLNHGFTDKDYDYKNVLERGGYMKTTIDKIGKWSVLGLVVALLTSLGATSVYAHGEKSQAAFMRMRTIIWYDLHWSEDSVKVNETVEITGKMHVFKGWPETVDKPEIAFLNIGIPGPVFIRQESYIGGQLVPRSVTLELDKDYEFKVVLKARRPGDWHVHTMMNISGGGPVIGPGKWVTITGSMANFKNQITTLTGKTVDIETFGEANIWGWHALWFAVGIAWIVYWCRGPVFLPRFIMCQAGRAKELISPAEKKVGIGFTIGTIVLVLFGYSNANSNYPITIPLQGGLQRNMTALPNMEADVHVKVDEATYRVPGRAMKLVLTVHNGGDTPVQMAELQAGAIRFLDGNVYEDDTRYPEDILAPTGLEVDDNAPLQPDETRTYTVTASDAAWEIERMADIIYDPDSRFGALLFWVGADGSRTRSSIQGPLIPVFM